MIIQDLTLTEKMNFLKLVRFDLELSKSFDIDILNESFIKDIDINILDIDDYCLAVFNLLKYKEVRNNLFINKYSLSQEMVGSSVKINLNIPFINGSISMSILVGNVGIISKLLEYEKIK